MAGGIIAKQVAQEVITGTPQLLYIGGTAVDGSDAPIAISSAKVANLATTTTIGGNPVASQNYANSLLASYVVAGSAVTSIDFSGLDINTHKSYRVEIDIKGNSTGNLYCFINGDTTISNYYSQEIHATNTSIGTSRNNQAYIGYIYSASYAVSVGNVSINNGYAVGSFRHNRELTTNTQIEFSYVIKNATVTNITQLTFTSGVANGFGIGSTIRIYRQDV